MTHKKAKNYKEAWELQQTYTGQPHGWIQWKGTDVCMDVHCVCGAMTHIDDSHCYVIQCPECDRIYFLNGNIEFIELTDPISPDTAKIPQILGAKQ